MEWLSLAEWLVGGVGFAFFWGWAGWQMRGHNEVAAREAADKAAADIKAFEDKVSAAVDKALGKTPAPPAAPAVTPPATP